MELVTYHCACGRSHVMMPASERQPDRVMQTDPCPCPPPHKSEPDWQAAFVEADNARSKAEMNLKRERETSDRFQKENNALSRRVAEFEENLKRAIPCVLASARGELCEMTKDRNLWKVSFEQIRKERDEAREISHRSAAEIVRLEENYARIVDANSKLIKKLKALAEDL